MPTGWGGAGGDGWGRRGAGLGGLGGGVRVSEGAVGVGKVGMRGLGQGHLCCGEFARCGVTESKNYGARKA